MDLESVRELKRSLQEQLLAKLATTVQARSALGEAAHVLGDCAGRRRPRSPSAWRGGRGTSSRWPCAFSNAPWSTAARWRT